MHVQVVNFRLKGISVADYGALCDQLAPAFAAVPGLIAKIWLANPDTGVFGGVYTWRDRAAMETYTRSDLFAAVLAHPNLDSITSQDFGILAGPTAITHGLAAVPA